MPSLPGQYNGVLAHCSNMVLELPQPHPYTFPAYFLCQLVPHTFKCFSGNELLWDPYKTYDLNGKASTPVKFCHLWFLYSGAGQMAGMQFLLNEIMGTWKWGAYKVEHESTLLSSRFELLYEVEGKALATWMRLRGIKYAQGKYQRRGWLRHCTIGTLCFLVGNVQTSPSPDLCSSHFLSCLVEYWISFK